MEQTIQQEEWWGSEGGFFGKIYLEGDNSLEGFLHNPKDLEARIENEINGVIRLCTLQEGSAILDCPSGYGRHSLALARRGFQVVGMDINNFFLKIANEQRKKLALANCRFEKKDMRTLNFSDEFDAVINMFYSFGFFASEEENFKVLTNFHKALKPGGRFLMHTHITLPKIMNGDYKRHEIRTLKSGNKLELFRNYNPDTKRENGQWFIIYPDGRKEASTPYSMRIYSTKEFIELCRSAGFTKVDAYGDWDGVRYKDVSPLLISIAKK